ncbi:MAG: ATP-binding protein, partial [Pseudanabaenaceae cyanobacterium bins.68]|nr:ATP-binding protein [Pseudanabaenaceae cyanobacterium bins.68]
MPPASNLPKLPLKLPLSLVLIAPALLQVAMVVGAVGWLSWRNGQSAITELATKIESGVAGQIEQHLDIYFGAPYQLTETNIALWRSQPQVFQDKLALERYFALQLDARPEIDQIYVGLADGNIVLAGRGTDGNLITKATTKYPQLGFYSLDRDRRRSVQIKLEPRYDPRQRPWYRAAMANAQKTWSPVYRFIEGEMGITASEPFYDSQGKLVGVMAVDLTLERLSLFLRSLRNGQKGQLFILSRQGELLASSEPEMVPSSGKIQNPITQQAISTILSQTNHSLANLNQVKLLQLSFNQVNYLLRALPYRDAHGLNLIIVSVAAESEYIAQIAANTQDTIYLSVIAVAITLVLGIAIARWLTLPLVRIHAASAKLISGDFSQRADETQGTSEVSMLAQSFNQMAAMLQSSFTRLQTMNNQLEQQVAARTADLAISEQKFAKAFRCSPYPMTITTIAEGIFVEVNPSFCKLSGYTEEQLIGSNYLELGLWHRLEDRERLMGELQTEGRLVEKLVGLRDRHRQLHQILCSAEVIHLQNQDCVLWIALDVSDRLQAEAALKRTNTLLEAQKEVAIDGILSVDEQGRITFFNQRFCQIWQIPPALVEVNANIHWCVNTLQDLVEPVAELVSAIEYAYDSDYEPLQHELALPDSRVIDCFSSPLYIDGHFGGMVWYFRDITARVRAEQAEHASIRQIEKQNGLLLHLNQLPALVQGNLTQAIAEITELCGNTLEIEHISVWLWNASKTHLYCQDCYQYSTRSHLSLPLVTGETASNYLQLLGSERLVTAPFSSEQGSILSAPIRSLSGEVVGMVCLEKPEPEWSVELKSFATSLADLLVLGIEARDRQEINLHLRIAKDAAEVANTAKSEFLRHMSHQLRTPLNAILGFASLMESEPNLSPEQKEQLEIISDNGQELLNIIVAALEMSAIQAGKLAFNPEKFDLRRLLEPLEQKFLPRAIAKQLELKFETEIPDSTQVYSDLTKLTHILDQLLTNAITFTDQGVVKLRIYQPSPTQIGFEVTDTGIGIAPEQLEKIFEAFGKSRYATANQTGVGLGLPIIQNYVQILGGQLQVSSKLGQGSCFHFEIGCGQPT